MSRLYCSVLKKSIALLGVAVIFFAGFQVAAKIPNDPEISEQLPMWLQIKAPDAWDYTTGSKKIVVAVIDTGLDTWHEDLRDNIWVNENEIPDNGKDDDHNGYVDDVNGWNFAENNNNVRTSVFDSADDKEAVRHGTLIGGLVGAKGNNGLDGTGLNWNVSIMPLRAIKSNGSGSFRAVSKSIDYAVDNGADVISLSFMGDVADTGLYESLQRAYKKGVVIVAAGGNYDATATSTDGNLDRKPVYPGCFLTEDGSDVDWMLTVGSVDANDKLSEFSEYGRCLNITAPGEYIYSTERYAPQFGYPNQFNGPWFGTSFATPLVAGTAALIKSIHPEWTSKEIISRILGSAEDNSAENPGRDGQIGSGRLDAGQAVKNAFSTPMHSGKGNIFFYKGNELWSFDLSKTKIQKLTTFTGSAVAIGTVQFYNHEEAALLVKRGSSYFLRIYREDGKFINELALPKGSVNSGKIRIKFNDGIWTVVSARYDSRANATIFTTLTSPKKVVNKKLSGKINFWDVDQAGNIFTGSLNGGVMNLHKNDLHYPGVENIKEILGFSSSGDRVVALVKRDGDLALLTVEANGAINFQPVDQKWAGKRWYLKEMVMADRTYFIPYAAEGGSFVVYDQDLNPSLTIKVPKLPF